MIKPALDNGSLCVDCQDFINGAFPAFSTAPENIRASIDYNSMPKWTLMYSTEGDRPGCAWEFFNNEQAAKNRAERIRATGNGECVKVPFDYFRDIHALRKNWR
jgi:hypothetical protein